MSAIPTFEIGIWNAWILTLYVALHPLIMMLIDKLVGTGDIFKKMGDTSALNKTQNIMNIFGTVLFFELFRVLQPLRQDISISAHVIHHLFFGEYLP